MSHFPLKKGKPPSCCASHSLTKCCTVCQRHKPQRLMILAYNLALLQCSSDMHEQCESLRRMLSKLCSQCHLVTIYVWGLHLYVARHLTKSHTCIVAARAGWWIDDTLMHFTRNACALNNPEPAGLYAYSASRDMHCNGDSAILITVARLHMQKIGCGHSRSNLQASTQAAASWGQGCPPAGSSWG